MILVYGVSEKGIEVLQSHSRSCGGSFGSMSTSFGIRSYLCVQHLVHFLQPQSGHIFSHLGLGEQELLVQKTKAEFHCPSPDGADRLLERDGLTKFLYIYLNGHEFVAGDVLHHLASPT